MSTTKYFPSVDITLTVETCTIDHYDCLEYITSGRLCDDCRPFNKLLSDRPPFSEMNIAQLSFFLNSELLKVNPSRRKT